MVLLKQLPDGVESAMKTLELPSAQFDNLEIFQSQVMRMRTLRELDLSGTSVTGECGPRIATNPADDNLFAILDGCPLLQKIDLTSCRGVRVQNRRGIFKVCSNDTTC